MTLSLICDIINGLFMRQQLHIFRFNYKFCLRIIRTSRIWSLHHFCPRILSYYFNWKNFGLPIDVNVMSNITEHICADMTLFLS